MFGTNVFAAFPQLALAHLFSAVHPKKLACDDRPIEPFPLRDNQFREIRVSFEREHGGFDQGVKVSPDVTKISEIGENTLAVDGRMGQE